MRPVMTRIGNPHTGFKGTGEALFHHWGVETVEAETGFGNFKVAVVEFPDGRVDTFLPSNILFIDGEDQAQAVIDAFNGDPKAA
ncbi:hypothetical protein [Pseudomonas aphyarum]|uniref:Uncharacterized protein n=1 Tax=Pseudomonas aphyarum TaxID=2942629 RepID=A0ABT5PP10_9PSED|nr:hypothetical protein [Pseudomonas aphyarum]MDD0971641.1 hypothetical protein [Pseudomonas aphyarum]MDD1125207.1 hypothetical protein [Pseudomonas aphyarum]